MVEVQKRCIPHYFFPHPYCCEISRYHRNASQNVRDGDFQADVRVPRPVVLDVAHPLVEGQQLRHAIGRQHVVLVNQDEKVSAANVWEVVTAPLLVLFVGAS